MQITHSCKPLNSVDYYPLRDGMAQVYMRKNFRTESDEDGNLIHIADEVTFKINQDVTKAEIEQNFEYMWSDAEKIDYRPSLEEQLEVQARAIEDLTMLVLGGALNG